MLISSSLMRLTMWCISAQVMKSKLKHRDELKSNECRIDHRLGRDRICSNEIVEISGSSGSGKTFFCLKMAAYALIEENVGVIYVDTTNYLNNENLAINLKVRFLSIKDDIELHERCWQGQEAREDAWDSW
jgi:RecA/RadA recombinase